MSLPTISEEGKTGSTVSVVVPAHNEEAVIGRLLRSLSPKGRGWCIQVIVACNGCTDRTAEIARSHGAEVVEVEKPSKISALNAADELAVGFPRLYVDADIVLTGKAIADLADALSEPGILCAAPPYVLELGGRCWLVRAYFSVWLEVMKLNDGYVGSGVYALSEQGRARFGRFPEVVADDAFVRNLFTRAERRIVPTDPTIVQAPWTLSALFRRRVRLCIGNKELSALHGSIASRHGMPFTTLWWRIVSANPRLIPATTIYICINGLAHLAANWQIRRKGSIDWGRDETSRSTPAS